MKNFDTELKRKKAKHQGKFYTYTFHSFTSIRKLHTVTQIFKIQYSKIHKYSRDYWQLYKLNKGNFLFCITYTDYKINISIQDQCILLVKEHPEVKLTMWICTTQITSNSQV